ncbi:MULTISPECIES: NAD-dependent epimerase/dehydratase family protein [Agrobacterium]|jgi:UDP-glucose 4-epimerase|uniref:NAD-dependent epimerase/dehydratase family protein n=1 Tax=Agrobacterium TaxID=357 RepID=UPI0002333DFE|nr:MULTISPECIES: NAD-dependent epimerase/dehydratase family protein [Agrobacterium]EHH06053.1 NAD-dependent epimerase/dehydratase [Agrobacterium tumefaciens CCNWGS0286]QAB00568.1 epimerase [Agrobacterium tumefaciens]UXS27359.1 NAD-dependent epimerase/dehydratase family protein [Agrobacterium tumefaciens]UXS54142.1 NAD-dependent epimerase/dehydratase family protein [Agrobacterium tumefaciens]UXS65884.1 NAD-dependent epimerase/dehydratase family protein [Agrobacterium tumefaciens]
MKILVTGGAGFIGSFLCDYLIAKGHQVTAYDDLSLGRRRNIEHQLNAGALEFIEGDILDESRFEDVVKSGNFECVFHMAANSDIARSHASPSIDLKKTFLTTFQVLEAARKFDIKQIVFASTSAIYGETKGKVAETYGPLVPISHYGAGKLASEAFISSYCENYGIKAWITRFPNVVGPRATHGAVYDFVRKLIATPGLLNVLGDGTQVKPYLYVEDLVRAILLVWEKTDQKINIYNVGADTRSTVADIAQIVIEESGERAEIAYTGGDRGWIGDVPKFEYDTSALNSLGWQPTMTSDDAIRAAARAIWKEQR